MTDNLKTAQEITLALIQRGYRVSYEDCGAGWCIAVHAYEAPDRYLWICPDDGPYGHLESELTEPYARFMLCVYNPASEDPADEWWDAYGQPAKSTIFDGRDLPLWVARAMTTELKPFA